MTLSTLKAIAEKLPPARFIRIHRSYMLPVAKIRSVANNTRYGNLFDAAGASVRVKTIR